jgi:hypothetical protein
MAPRYSFCRVRRRPLLRFGELRLAIDHRHRPAEARFERGHQLRDIIPIDLDDELIAAEGKHEPPGAAVREDAGRPAGDGPAPRAIRAEPDGAHDLVIAIDDDDFVAVDGEIAFGFLDIAILGREEGDLVFQLEIGLRGRRDRRLVERRRA